MSNVFDVANWFLVHESMTHKKLQKLCYYAQAWHCALYGNPFYEEEIQAWVHGPVSPTLYSKYSEYKWDKIPQYEEEIPCFTDEDTKILKAVYNTYGGFSGDQLERLTHSETPWKSARGNLNPWEVSSTAISTDCMKEYYRNKYEQAQND